MPLSGKRVVLGVTGGIAAFKSIEVCRRLVDSGAHVIPVLTDSALNMIGETTFRALASEPPKTSLWNDSEVIPHTYLGQTADLMVVCPATARIISDMRTGRSGDLLSATLVATRAPVIVCPAMHTEMWEHPAIQENIRVLSDRGVVIVPPEEGRLAGGDVGKGRLADPERIVQVAVETLRSQSPQLLAGRSIVVTAGGTREAIDPVRFIGNRSTGKQGHAIAEAALRAGADVTLITTSRLPSSPSIHRIEVTTAAELHAAVSASLPGVDVIIMAAAVADFTPSAPAEHKIKKADGIPAIGLVPTADVLADLGRRKAAGETDALLVGFAAETENLAENARSKLKRKGADLIVANDVAGPDGGFAHNTNAVTIYSSDGGEIPLSLRSKADIGTELCTLISTRL